MSAVSLVRNEPRPDTVNSEGNKLRFDFTTVGRTDGITFSTGCSEWVKLRLTLDGRRVRPRRILLGPLGRASKNPLRLRSA